MANDKETLKKLPLHDLHVSLGGKMVPFAGYEMPVQYPMGVMKEHLHVREKAGLFDVSHMGPCYLKTTETQTGTEDAHLAVADAIESLVPGEIRKLGRGRARYTVFLNETGGILDDLMITRPAEDDFQGWLFLVVNAAVKEQDFALMQEKLAGRTELEVASDRALLALQGPAAAGVMASLVPETAKMPFMSTLTAELDGAPLTINRCGYTGEDGYELLIRNEDAQQVAEKLLSHEDVEPIGLGARDSLRLESGLCLYGHDLTPETSPVEGNISFAIGKRRREEGGFPGADRIRDELTKGPARLRVGIRPEGRAPAREGTEIQNVHGEKIGAVTSGGFGPTFEGPVAMGYVEKEYAKTGTHVQLLVRGKTLPAEVADMPFVPQRYYRGKK